MEGYGSRNRLGEDEKWRLDGWSVACGYDGWVEHLTKGEEFPLLSCGVYESMGDVGYSGVFEADYQPNDLVVPWRI